MCRIEEILTNRIALTQRGGGVLFERRGGNTRMHAGMQQACLHVCDIGTQTRAIKTKERKKESILYQTSCSAVLNDPENRAHPCFVHGKHLTNITACFFPSFLEVTSLFPCTREPRSENTKHKAGMPSAFHALLREHMHTRMPTAKPRARPYLFCL